VLTMRKEGAYALDDNGDYFGHVASGFQLAYWRWPNPPATRCSPGGPGLQLGDRTPAGSVKQEAYVRLQQEDDRVNVLGQAGTRRVCCHLYSA
jgi:hypothetical protein